MAHQRVDLVGERDADDRLAVAGAGDRGGRVVGPRAGGDQRRVADAAGVLAVDAAGRGRRGDAAARVARDRADRAAAAVVARALALGGPMETTRPARCRGPAARANAPADSPTSITCRPSSSTARAARTGLRMPRDARRPRPRRGRRRA